MPPDSTASVKAMMRSARARGYFACTYMRVGENPVTILLDGEESLWVADGGMCSFHYGDTIDADVAERVCAERGGDWEVGPDGVGWIMLPLEDFGNLAGTVAALGIAVDEITASAISASLGVLNGTAS